MRCNSRARGSRRRLAVFVARHVVSHLRLQSHARFGTSPHRRGGATWQNRVDHRCRQRASTHWAFRCGIHSRHPLGSVRICHRIAHTAGRHHSLGRLQDRPHTSGRSAHRLGSSRRSCGWRRHPFVDARQHKCRRAWFCTFRKERWCGVAPVVCRTQEPTHHHRKFCQPYSPRAADCRGRNRRRSCCCAAWSIDDQQRAHGARLGHHQFARPINHRR